MLALYQRALVRRPLLTQSITTAILFGTGDIIAQQAVEKKGSKHDLARTGRMMFYGGCIFGPAATTWFKFLSNRVVTQNKWTTIGARVACDQLLFAPTNLFCFLSTMAILEGKQPREKLASTYAPVLKKNFQVWPFVQFVNFGFVPLHHRVLVVNVISIGWNCYLSTMSA